MKKKNFLIVLVISSIIASCSTARVVSLETATSVPQDTSEHSAGDPVQSASQAQSIAEIALKNKSSLSYTEPLTTVKIAILSLGEFNQLLQLPFGQSANLGSDLYFESENYKQHHLEKYYQAIWLVVFFSDKWQTTLNPLNGAPFPTIHGCYFVAITADGGSTINMGTIDSATMAECKK